jgi:hypothetical protein
VAQHVTLLACRAAPTAHVFSRFTDSQAASDIAAELRAETKGQPPIPFGIGGFVRADLTLPRSAGQSFIVGNIGHGGNRRCQATAGPQQRIGREAMAGHCCT